MKAGFSGTRYGMNHLQRQNFGRFLDKFDSLSHGDCIGADADAHTICAEAGKEIFIYPPVEDAMFFLNRWLDMSAFDSLKKNS
jgi:hypothetical protein